MALSWASAILLVSIRWQWLPAFAIAPLEPARPVPRMAQLPDEVVVRALDGGRTAFLGCWKRAQRIDPLLDATKVKIRVEIDASGGVVAVTHDATNEKLGSCLAMVARGMKFPGHTTPAFAEFPLFFQPE